MAGNQEAAVTRAHGALKDAKRAIRSDLSAPDRRKAEDAVKQANQVFNGAYQTYAQNMRAGGHTPKSQSWWS